MHDSRLPMFTDLTALANAIAGRNGMNRVRALVARAKLVQSCLADLAEASNCCEAITATLRPDWDRSDAVTAILQVSALHRAVLLYERSTSAGAKMKERGSVKIRDHLTDAQKADHDSLVRIRHRSLAHVYVGEDIGGETWHDSVLFAMEIDGGWVPASSSRRVHFHRPTYECCMRQVPVAIGILGSRCQVQLDKLTNALNEGGLPRDLYERFAFDPVATFGSVEAARHIVDSRSDGATAFIG